jgi:hypothetical protein
MAMLPDAAIRISPFDLIGSFVDSGELGELQIERSAEDAWSDAWEGSQESQSLGSDAA